MAKVRIAAFSISLDCFAGPRQDLNYPLGVRGIELDQIDEGYLAVSTVLVAKRVDKKPTPSFLWAYA